MSKFWFFSLTAIDPDLLNAMQQRQPRCNISQLANQQVSRSPVPIGSTTLSKNKIIAWLRNKLIKFSCCSQRKRNSERKFWVCESRPATAKSNFFFFHYLCFAIWVTQGRSRTTRRRLRSVHVCSSPFFFNDLISQIIALEKKRRGLLYLDFN